MCRYRLASDRDQRKGNAKRKKKEEEQVRDSVRLSETEEKAGSCVFFFNSCQRQDIEGEGHMQSVSNQGMIIAK